VEKGNTVIVIEHNLDVVKSADHLIDIPKAGTAAGKSSRPGPRRRLP
jgi:excinuclease ABC subunit A